MVQILLIIIFLLSKKTSNLNKTRRKSLYEDSDDNDTITFSQTDSFTTTGSTISGFLRDKETTLFNTLNMKCGLI